MLTDIFLTCFTTLAIFIKLPQKTVLNINVETLEQLMIQQQSFFRKLALQQTVFVDGSTKCARLEIIPDNTYRPDRQAHCNLQNISIGSSIKIINSKFTNFLLEIKNPVYMHKSQI